MDRKNGLENTMLVDLEESFENFVEAAQDMPTVWLLNYYKKLSHDNEKYHEMVDVVLDISDGEVIDDPVIDMQIDCFNRMLSLHHILQERNVSIPNFEVGEI